MAVRLSMSVSLDGYAAGLEQRADAPLGTGGEALHRWVLGTRTFRATHGAGDGGTTGLDDDVAREIADGIGASILGRRMFGGGDGGPWDPAWRGWWGDDPPFHTPVFVLTHHPRAPVAMQGGTTFHFVTGGIQEALERAREAARTQDVRIGGGVSTVRQYLQAGLVDELHLVVSPTVLGSGEPLLAAIDLPRLGFRCSRHVGTNEALHVVLQKAPAA